MPDDFENDNGLGTEEEGLEEGQDDGAGEEGGEEETLEPDPVREKLEQIAKTDGWMKKASYIKKHGSAEGWTPAEKYLLNGGPLHHKRKRDLDQMAESLETTKEALAAVKAFNEKVNKQEQAALRSEIDRLKKERTAAIREGDPDLVDELDTQIHDAQVKASENEQALAGQRGGEIKPVFADWFEKNPWYNDPDGDADMKELADSVAIKAAEEGLTDKARLIRVDRVLRETFPEKFNGKGNGNGKAAATGGQAGAVLEPSRGGGPGGSGGRSKGFSDLPKDAQESAIRGEKAGGLSRQDYAKQYFA